MSPSGTNPPLEGSLLNLVGAGVPELAYTVWSTGAGMTCGEDIMVGALRSCVSEREPELVTALRSEWAIAPAEAKRSSRFLARAVWMILSTASGIAGLI